MSEEDFNPYASPLSSLVPQIVAEDEIWRFGPLLVTSRKVALPDRCVKCNAPAERRRVTLLLYRHHPGVYWIFVLPLLTAVLGVPAMVGSLFIALMLYVVVALIARWRAVLRVGLCGRHLGRRRLAIGVAWTFFLGGLGVSFYGCSIANWAMPAGLILALGGFLVTIGGSVYGTFASRVVWPQKIDRTFAWIKGVSPEYLAELPMLPPALSSDAPFVSLLPPRALDQ